MGGALFFLKPRVSILESGHLDGVNVESGLPRTISLEASLVENREGAIHEFLESSLQ